MRSPIFHRRFDYDRTLLPNAHLRALEEGVTSLDEARLKSGATIGYPGWGVLYHLILSSLPKDRECVLVETGTNWGSSTIIIAEALRASGARGHVYTFEIDPTNIERARANIAAAGLAEFVTLIEGDAKVKLAEFAAGISRIDFAFLDGSHLLEDVMREFQAVVGKLAPSALVCFDNTYKIADDGEDPRVFGALKEIKRRHGGNLLNLPFVSWYTPGLAVWQRSPLGEWAGARGRPGGRFHSLERTELIERIRKERFFHAMNLGELQVSSWVYGTELPPNYHLFPGYKYLPEIDLAGATCLDLGTYDGLTAFQLCELGAKEVHAVCQYSLDRFLLVHALRGYPNLFYHPETHLSGLSDIFREASFDLVVVSAMLHHHPAPSAALLAIRRLLRRGGLFLLEAAVSMDDTPETELNTIASDPVYGVPTIWVHSERTLAGMLNLAGFEIVSRTRLVGTETGREGNNHRRVTFLARAAIPEQIPARSAKLTAVQDEATWVEGIAFKDLAGAPPATIAWSGKTGERRLSIWETPPEMPLQPTWVNPRPSHGTQVTVGTVDYFRELMRRRERYQWGPEDVPLFSARYPTEHWPEGMTWCMKQFGNLHCIDKILSLGMGKVLEVGPGFNYYFNNKLPAEIDYWRIDDDGFYPPGYIELARTQNNRGKYVRGMMGEFSGDLPDASFDCCFSVSVLEHVPHSKISNVAADMWRVTRPGGWTVHSIDCGRGRMALARNWLDALLAAGFVVDAERIDIDVQTQRKPGKEPFTEPLSLIQTFYGGYSAKPWREPAKETGENLYYTVLIAMRRPDTPKA